MARGIVGLLEGSVGFEAGNGRFAAGWFGENRLSVRMAVSLCATL